MTYYNLINWDSVPIDKILSAIPIPAYTRGEVVPIARNIQFEIFNMLNVDLSKCTVAKIMLVYLPPKSRITIHSDQPKETTDPAKLNRCIFLPLKSCEQLIWSWYEVTDPTKIYYYGEAQNWQTVPMVPYPYAKEIASVPCNKSFLSDIGNFHALRNEADEPAIGISIRLMPWAWDPLGTEPLLPPIPGMSIL